MRLRSDTEIYIARDGSTYGPPRSVDEARRQLTDRRLQPHDMAWCQGLSEWVPLATLLSDPVVPAPQQAFVETGGTAAKDSPFRRSSRGGLKIRKVGGVHRIFSLLNRNVKKERIGHNQFGDALWTFCLSASRDFHAFFRKALQENDVRLTETQEFSASQEILLMNLWLISRELPRDKKSVMIIHQKYFARQGKMAAAMPSAEQAPYIQQAKRMLVERCGLYHQLWNARRFGDQTVLAAYLIEFVVNGGKPHPSSSDRKLIGYMNSYLRAMPKTIQELRERFELTG